MWALAVRKDQLRWLSIRYEWMGLSGESGESGGDFGEAGADVGCGGAGIVVVGVASACPRDGVAEVAFNPGQRGMTKPVSADLLLDDPGKMSANADPDVIVSARGYHPSISVAQQLAAYRSVTLLGVPLKVSHQGGGYGLPAECSTLLPETDKALVGVEIIWP